MKNVVIAMRDITGLSGATTFALEHTRGFVRLGHRVVLFGERLDAQRIRAAGGIPHRISRFPVGKYFRRRVFAKRFERYASRHSFDIVGGHGDVLRQDVVNFHNCLHLAHEIIRGRPLPADSAVGRIHAQILIEGRFRMCIANSHLMAQDFIPRFGLPPQKVRVIHPGYDPERFNVRDRARFREETRKRLGIADETVLVGLITSGNFTKRGVRPFIQACGMLPEATRARMEILITGSESHKGPYLDQARELGLAGRLRMLPPQPSVERIYHALDILVHPAHIEEFGMGVLEAMACGVPVLTTRRVGATELFGAEGRSTLLDSPAPEPLSQALNALIVNPDMRSHWNGYALEAVSNGNTWRQHTDRYLETLQDLGLL